MKIQLNGPSPLESLSYAELQAIHQGGVFLDYHELKQIVDAAVLQAIEKRFHDRSRCVNDNTEDLRRIHPEMFSMSPIRRDTRSGVMIHEQLENLSINGTMSPKSKLSSPKARKIIEAIRGDANKNGLTPAKYAEKFNRLTPEEIQPREAKKMWMVLKAHTWGSVTIPILGGMPITGDQENGPQRFIPVFDTYEQAMRFVGGDDSLIARIEEVVK